MKFWAFLCLLATAALCFGQKKPADLIITNATIYTAEPSFRQTEAIALRAGKIIATGTTQKILKNFKGPIKNYQGKFIYPGFNDAHAHFYGCGATLQNANLKNLNSWEKTVATLREFAATHPHGWLLGRGWDQNLWPEKEFPTKKLLDELFPDRPVFLTRVDGHAAIANQKALDIAKFNPATQIAGGELLKDKNGLTGVLIDNAKDQMMALIPQPSEAQTEDIFREAERQTVAAGLTSITDAGLDFPLIETVQRLQNSNRLKTRLNLMLSDSDRNISWLTQRGKISTPRLKVLGFKFYSDGALGSRGACLLADYSDKPHHRGMLLSDPEHFKKRAAEMHRLGFQMSTHAIGDSANRFILKVYADVLKGKNDRRWRIEHAQIISPEDFQYFGKYNIVPSVQPTHATSDMPWAGERLGAARLKNAYAYSDLMKQNGWIPLGTDFPIEEIYPLYTFYAATARKNLQGFPAEGFQKENALTRQEALLGITLWPAYAAFEEKEKGTLEVGKYADFVVLNQDIMAVPEDLILKTQILETWINGERVYAKP